MAALKEKICLKEKETFGEPFVFCACGFVEGIVGSSPSMTFDDGTGAKLSIGSINVPRRTISSSISARIQNETVRNENYVFVCQWYLVLFIGEGKKKEKKKLAHNIDVVVIIVGFLPSLQKEKRERKKTRKIINKCFFHV